MLSALRHFLFGVLLLSSVNVLAESANKADNTVTTPAEGDDDTDDEDLPPPARRPFEEGIFKGIGATILGGAAIRARADLNKFGNQLGPAGDLAPLGGMLAIQLWTMFTRYLRLGGDFTYEHIGAQGEGPDGGGIQIRQTVGYDLFLGGFLAEGVWPLGERVELSLGVVFGGGGVNVSAFSTRVSSFNQLGTSLAAIPKTDSVSLYAPFLQLKPAAGLRVKASAHLALDLRVGMNTVYVAAGALGFSGLQLAGSPQVVELQPFVSVGASFGDWYF